MVGFFFKKKRGGGDGWLCRCLVFYLVFLGAVKVWERGKGSKGREEAGMFTLMNLLPLPLSSHGLDSGFPSVCTPFSGLLTLGSNEIIPTSSTPMLTKVL